MHIYVGPPAGPCTLLLFERGCDRPTHFVTGEFLLCLSLHQTAAYALFLWGIWERETVIVSVASSMYYIMARFFVGWCKFKVDVQNTIPTYLTWLMLHCGIIPPHKLQTYLLDVLKPSNIGQKLILRILKYLLAYLKYGFRRGSAIALSSLNPRILKGSKQ